MISSRIISRNFDVRPKGHDAITSGLLMRSLYLITHKICAGKNQAECTLEQNSDPLQQTLI